MMRDVRVRAVAGGVAAAVVFTGLLAAARAEPEAEPARASLSAALIAATPPSPTGAPDPSRSIPVRIRIGKIKVSAPVREVTLKQDGTIEGLPLREHNLAGWDRRSVPPGPTVILGHVDSKRGPSVFYRLDRLRKGDRVELTRADGAVTGFIVTAVERVPKKRFPGEKVYGGAGLRLITCGGGFDPARGSYRDNIIVYARPA